MYLLRDIKRKIKVMPIVGDMAFYLYKVSLFPLKVAEQKKHKNALLLNSMMKSGSHYFMSVLANYLHYKYLQATDRLDFVAMKELIWNVNEEKSKELKIIKEETGYSAFIWQHFNPFIKYSNAKKIIHLYRNPLDIIISRYYYDYVNRLNYDSPVNSPSDIIEIILKEYILHYRSIDEIKEKEKVLKIAYESLILRPVETFEKALDFLGIEKDVKILKNAIEASSQEKVKEDEKKRGLQNGNLVGKNMKSGFIRSGKIGEWKDYFSQKDIDKIEAILGEESFSLDQFILEP